jgi:hypothetical protein
MLTVQENPACAADPQLPASIAPALRDDVARRRRSPAAVARPAEPDAGQQGEAHRTRRHDLPAASRSSSSPGDDEPLPGLRLDSDRPGTAAPPPPAFPAAEEPLAGPAIQPARERTDPPDVGDDCIGEPGALTHFAGLFFVVPMLDRLGFAAWVAERPGLLDAHVAARLLRFVGARAGMPPDDPLALALQRDIGEGPEGDLPFEPLLTSWTTAVRRWSRRHARQGLATLIRRPGRVHVSRTHVDVCFGLSQIDLRLRRLALDVDPGWVPWLGRVVQVMYLDSDEQRR